MNDIFKSNVLTRIRYKLAHNELLDTYLTFAFIVLLLDGFIYLLHHNGKLPKWSE